MKSFSVVLSHYKGSDMPTSCEVGRHWCVGWSSLGTDSLPGATNDYMAASGNVTQICWVKVQRIN